MHARYVSRDLPACPWSWFACEEQRSLHKPQRSSRLRNNLWPRISISLWCYSPSFNSTCLHNGDGMTRRWSSLYTASALISLDFQSRLDPQDIGATQSCTACDWEGLGAVFYRWAWLVYRSEFEGMISCYDSDRHSHCNSICHPSATGMQCSSDQGRDINTRKYIARANASQLRAHYKIVYTHDMTEIVEELKMAMLTYTFRHGWPLVECQVKGHSN